MSTTQPGNTKDPATLTTLDREWLRRQGRAARMLEARQRTAVRDRRRGRAAYRALRPPAPRS